VLFGDITHSEALALANVKKARLIAFTFPNVAATKIAIPLVLQENSEITIFARAKFSFEAMELRLLGARVIHDEKESAAAMVTKALATYEETPLTVTD
jgi:CPA2 family monovalent cation:H+ antiporter-2